ncbi:MAG: DUF6457 domain-containing protein [Pseudolysinimonas sp.]
MSDDTELARWAKELAEALGLETADIPDIPMILDLARDAAHNVMRPAAPLTTFLVGYAVGLGRGTTAELAAIASELAAARPAP